MWGVPPATAPAICDVAMCEAAYLQEDRESSITYRANEFANLFLFADRFTLPANQTLKITRIKKSAIERANFELKPLLNDCLRLKGKAIRDIIASESGHYKCNTEEEYLTICSGDGELVIETARFTDCFAGLADLFEQLQEPGTELQFGPDQRLVLSDFDESIVNDIYNAPAEDIEELLFQLLDSKVPPAGRLIGES